MNFDGVPRNFFSIASERAKILIANKSRTLGIESVTPSLRQRQCSHADLHAVVLLGTIERMIKLCKRRAAPRRRCRSDSM